MRRPPEHTLTRSRQLVVLFLLLAAALVGGAPGADAAVRPPKWLLPPYHYYGLTYQADSSFDGTAVNSFPSPAEERCDFHETTATVSGRSRVRLVFGFVFGRYRDPGGGTSQTYVVSSHRTLDHAAAGAVEEVDQARSPAGCPSSFWGYPSDSGPRQTCETSLRMEEFPTLEIRARDRLRRLRARISAPALGGERHCDDGYIPSADGDFGGFTWVTPGEGTISYSIGGILSGRTFHGRVAAAPAGARGGQGTVPAGLFTAQSVWSEEVGRHGTLTMAPAGRSGR